MIQLPLSKLMYWQLTVIIRLVCSNPVCTTNYTTPTAWASMICMINEINKLEKDGFIIRKSSNKPDYKINK